MTKDIEKKTMRGLGLCRTEEFLRLEGNSFCLGCFEGA